MVSSFSDCKECIYLPGDRIGPRSIIMGLFPPANADVTLQHDNRTTLEIWKLKGDLDWDWNDIAPFSPNGFAYDFDQKWFAKEVKGRTVLAYSLLCAWWADVVVLES
jgi:hypothetical protein